MFKINKDIIYLVIGLTLLVLSLFIGGGVLFILKNIFFYPEIRIFYTNLMPFAYHLFLFYLSLYLIFVYIKKINLIQVKYLGLKIVILFYLTHIIPGFFHEENKINIAAINIFSKQLKDCDLELKGKLIKDDKKTVEISPSLEEIEEFKKIIKKEVDINKIKNVTELLSTFEAQVVYDKYHFLIKFSNYPKCIINKYIYINENKIDSKKL